MDTVVTAFISNAPYAAVFLYMLNRVYQDWKDERAQAYTERLAMANQITALQSSIDKLTANVDALAVSLGKPVVLK
jgi:hypothetical protein